ncbi:Neuralized-like protein 4 [Armadillidium vulgare]|nr:Neuralized-like protein 4 [Armadillidium vulgare]
MLKGNKILEKLPYDCNNKLAIVTSSYKYKYKSITGNPPKQYAQPVGWCRFSLVTAVGENNESWHMAYHGIKGGAIRRMLDKGELLFAGKMVQEGEKRSSLGPYVPIMEESVWSRVNARTWVQTSRNGPIITTMSIPFLEDVESNLVCERGE